MLDVSPSVRRRVGFVAGFWRVLFWPLRVAEARRNLALLSRMNDRELSDIGLLRSDLFACAALPRGEDPTVGLAAVRAARARFAPRRSQNVEGVFDGPAEPPTLVAQRAPRPAGGGNSAREGGTELVRA